MKSRLLAVASILWSIGHATTAAPQTAPEAGKTDLDPIAVESSRRNPRINEQVSEFVTAIALPVQHESLARWSVPVCVLAAGLLPPESEFVRKRIELVAKEAGIAVGAPGCAANFVLVVTPDPQAFLKDWWADEPKLFSAERGLGGVERMIRTDQPVRVWHNACTAPPELARNFRLNVTLDCNATRAGSSSLGSRITRTGVRSIFSAIIVVDLNRIEGLTWGQVADYVAMDGLAQLRADPDLGPVPTILGLFKAGGDERAMALTVWDQAFLKSVYASRDGSVTELAQIKLKMTEDLAR